MRLSLTYFLLSVEDNFDYNNVTTGVVIQSTFNGISVIFGCYVKDVNQGGAGVVHLSLDGKKRTIHPLKQNGKQIYAGTMFLSCGSMTSSANTLHGLSLLIIASVFIIVSFHFNKH